MAEPVCQALAPVTVITHFLTNLEVYVPPGDYGMSTWVSLSGGQNWAFQLDGIIYRTGLAGSML